VRAQEDGDEDGAPVPRKSASTIQDARTEFRPPQPFTRARTTGEGNSTNRPRDGYTRDVARDPATEAGWRRGGGHHDVLTGVGVGVLGGHDKPRRQPTVASAVMVVRRSWSETCVVAVIVVMGESQDRGRPGGNRAGRSAVRSSRSLRWPTDAAGGELEAGRNQRRRCRRFVGSGTGLAQRQQRSSGRDQ